MAFWKSNSKKFLLLLPFLLTLVACDVTDGDPFEGLDNESDSASIINNYDIIPGTDSDTSGLKIDYSVSFNFTLPEEGESYREIEKVEFAWGESTTSTSTISPLTFDDLDTFLSLNDVTATKTGSASFLIYTIDDPSTDISDGSGLDLSEFFDPSEIQSETIFPYLIAYVTLGEVQISGQESLRSSGINNNQFQTNNTELVIIGIPIEQVESTPTNKEDKIYDIAQPPSIDDATIAASSDTDIAENEYIGSITITPPSTYDNIDSFALYYVDRLDAKIDTTPLATFEIEDCLTSCQFSFDGSEDLASFENLDSDSNEADKWKFAVYAVSDFDGESDDFKTVEVNDTIAADIVASNIIISSSVGVDQNENANAIGLDLNFEVNVSSENASYIDTYYVCLSSTYCTDVASISANGSSEYTIFVQVTDDTLVPNETFYIFPSNELTTSSNADSVTQTFRDIIEDVPGADEVARNVVLTDNTSSSGSSNYQGNLYFDAPVDQDDVDQYNLYFADVNTIDNTFTTVFAVDDGGDDASVSVNADQDSYSFSIADQSRGSANAVVLLAQNGKGESADEHFAYALINDPFHSSESAGNPPLNINFTDGNGTFKVISGDIQIQVNTSDTFTHVGLYYDADGTGALNLSQIHIFSASSFDSQSGYLTTPFTIETTAINWEYFRAMLIDSGDRKTPGLTAPIIDKVTYKDKDENEQVVLVDSSDSDPFPNFFEGSANFDNQVGLESLFDEGLVEDQLEGCVLVKRPDNTNAPITHYGFYWTDISFTKSTTEIEIPILNGSNLVPAGDVDESSDEMISACEDIFEGYDIPTSYFTVPIFESATSVPTEVGDTYLVVLPRNGFAGTEPDFPATNDNPPAGFLDDILNTYDRFRQVPESQIEDLIIGSDSDSEEGVLTLNIEVDVPAVETSSDSQFSITNYQLYLADSATNQLFTPSSLSGNNVTASGSNFTYSLSSFNTQTFDQIRIYPRNGNVFEDPSNVGANDNVKIITVASIDLFYPNPTDNADSFDATTDTDNSEGAIDTTFTIEPPAGGEGDALNTEPHITDYFLFWGKSATEISDDEPDPITFVEATGSTITLSLSLDFSSIDDASHLLLISANSYTDTSLSTAPSSSQESGVDGNGRLLTDTSQYLALDLSTIDSAEFDVNYPVLVSGGSHNCYLLEDKNVYCFGNEDGGRVGNGDTSGAQSTACYLSEFRTLNDANSTVFVGALDLDDHNFADNNDVGNIALNTVTDGGTSCAVLTNGDVKCWGGDLPEMLGNNSITLTSQIPSTPTDVTNLTDFALDIAVGESHVCALVKDSGGGNNKIKCWGNDSLLQLGNDGSEDDSSGNETVNVPVEVDLDSSIGLGNFNPTAVEAGRNHTCAIGDFDSSNTGFVVCWGANESEQSGRDSSTTEATTFRIDLDGGGQLQNVTQLALGENFSCAIDGSDEGVYCWGDNSVTQLGDSSLSGTENLAHVISSTITTDNAKQIAAGHDFACALLENGSVVCWGNGGDGQFGDNSSTTPASYSNSRIAELATSGTDITNATRVSAGAQHMCLTTSDNKMFCSGTGTDGQIGNGATSNVTRMTEVTSAFSAPACN